jgi:hypothetical protein
VWMEKLPYENTKNKDKFNFCVSSSVIHVEGTFFSEFVSGNLSWVGGHAFRLPSRFSIFFRFASANVLVVQSIHHLILLRILAPVFHDSCHWSLLSQRGFLFLWEWSSFLVGVVNFAAREMISLLLNFRLDCSTIHGRFCEHPLERECQSQWLLMMIPACCAKKNWVYWYSCHGHVGLFGSCRNISRMIILLWWTF